MTTKRKQKAVESAPDDDFVYGSPPTPPGHGEQRRKKKKKVKDQVLSLLSAPGPEVDVLSLVQMVENRLSWGATLGHMADSEGEEEEEDRASDTDEEQVVGGARQKRSSMQELARKLAHTRDAAAVLQEMFEGSKKKGTRMGLLLRDRYPGGRLDASALKGADARLWKMAQEVQGATVTLSAVILRLSTQARCVCTVDVLSVCPVLLKSAGALVERAVQAKLEGREISYDSEEEDADSQRLLALSKELRDREKASWQQACASAGSGCSDAVEFYCVPTGASGDEGAQKYADYTRVAMVFNAE